MRAYAGIDIGSTYIKVALVDDEGRSFATSVCPTGSSFGKNALAAFDQLLRDEGLARADIAYLIATGYGRKLFRDGDDTVSEISANARGAVYEGRKFGLVRTIINIGGQDSKVILLNEDGMVSNFGMNDKCAAGTGKFLEMASRSLSVEIDEMAALHLDWEGTPATISSTCTVFAESEIVSKLSAGHSRNEIAAGVHFSVAKRIARLANRVGIQDLVMLDGGAALNRGVAEALRIELMREVFVPEHPQLVTAIGAALLARERASE